MVHVVGKGQKVREVPVPTEVVGELSAYLAARGFASKVEYIGNQGAFLLGKASDAAARAPGLAARLQADPREGVAASTFYDQLKAFFAHGAEVLRGEGDAKGAGRFAKASTHWLPFAREPCDRPRHAERDSAAESGTRVARDHDRLCDNREQAAHVRGKEVLEGNDPEPDQHPGGRPDAAGHRRRPYGIPMAPRSRRPWSMPPTFRPGWKAPSSLHLAPPGAYMNEPRPSPDGRFLYVGIGSNSNITERGMEAEVDRAMVWQVDASTGARKPYATGLRNHTALAIQPGTDQVWAVVNERDELGPDLPPDYLTSVREGGFYGWPYSYWGKNVDSRVRPQNPEKVAPLSLRTTAWVRTWRRWVWISPHRRWVPNSRKSVSVEVGIARTPLACRSAMVAPPVHRSILSPAFVGPMARPVASRLG